MVAHNVDLGAAVLIQIREPQGDVPQLVSQRGGGAIHTDTIAGKRRAGDVIAIKSDTTPLARGEHDPGIAIVKHHHHDGGLFGEPVSQVLDPGVVVILPDIPDLVSLDPTRLEADMPPRRPPGGGCGDDDLGQLLLGSCERLANR